MPLPLFFHLAIILQRNLGLVKLPLSSLPVPDSYRSCFSSHRLAIYLRVADFPPLLIQPLTHMGVVFILVSG